MKAKNIQEYVAERIIAHMKYRDEEIKKLQEKMDKMAKYLGNMDIGLCDFCKELEYNDWSCEICERMSCVKCQKVDLCGSLENGCRMCGECTGTHCPDCKCTIEMCRSSYNCLGKIWTDF